MSDIFDGREQAKDLNERTRLKLCELGRKPQLTILYSANRPDQQSFTEIKRKTAENLGISLKVVAIPSEADEDGHIEMIKEEATNTDGMLVQLPIKAGLDRFRVLNAIPFEKDVEGLTAHRLGLLAQSTQKIYSPVAKACYHVLLTGAIYYDKPLKELTVALVGNSYLTVRPLSLILAREVKRVMICTEYDKNLAKTLKNADAIISATGVPGIITPQIVRRKSIRIDVGFVPQKDGTIIGDFDPSTYDIPGYYTPVPGGIGPLNVAYIFENLVHLIEEQNRS